MTLVKKPLLIVGSALLLLGGHANAACKQANVKGKWTMYQSVMTKIAAQERHIGRCDIEVLNNEGAYIGSCWLKGGVNLEFPAEGKIKVNKDCSADMTMDAAMTTFHLTLTSNQQMFRGWFNNEWDNYGTTNAVKR